MACTSCGGAPARSYEIVGPAVILANGAIRQFNSTEAAERYAGRQSDQVEVIPSGSKIVVGKAGRRTR